MVPIEYLLNFLKEDIPFGDITTNSIIPDTTCRAVITTEEPAVIAGLEEAGVLFRYHKINVGTTVVDGSTVRSGDVVLILQGDARTILTLERTALNIIGRMSGIATMTRRYAEKVHNVRPSCRVAATRKTCPGFRILDKKAVQIGGGDPHRWSLSDSILIKDNHLALVSLKDAIERAKACSSYHIIEVEVASRDNAVEAVKAGAHVIMLDNMSPDQVHETVSSLKKEGVRDRVMLEISGGIDEDNILRYASEDIDVISIGALTHSVKNISVHLDIHPQK
ncbi:MAG: nicotinate-nucleotide pyrophosphorylase [Methanoregula sp. PtaU1.Bin051]|nr:MAG: nicotinate-nucleotide pyrophosphorylase [Methanoregula sp. PtaU1.Bin051]